MASDGLFQFIEIVSITLLLGIFSSLTGAQAQPAILGPDAIVEHLYRMNETDQSPFFQVKCRATIDKYFIKNLADLIWKDALASDSDVGALDYDPLYGSQDPQITNLKILPTGLAGDARVKSGENVIVRVVFRDSGRKASASFLFEQDRARLWKISNITYPDGSSLRQTVEGSTRRECGK